MKGSSKNMITILQHSKSSHSGFQRHTTAVYGYHIVDHITGVISNLILAKQSVFKGRLMLEMKFLLEIVLKQHNTEPAVAPATKLYHNFPLSAKYIQMLKKHFAI